MLNSYLLRKLIGTVLVIGASLLPVKALSQENKQEQKCNYGGNIALDVNSKYLLRAIPLSDKMIISPSLTFSNGQITSSVVGIIDPNRQDANEADIIVDYTRPLTRHFDLSLGYTYVNFPDVGEKTQEVYSGLSFNTGLNPGIFVYWDFDFLTGTYIEASIAKDFKIGYIDLETKLNLAYNHRYFREGSGFSHLNPSIILPLKLSDKVKLTGRVNYVKVLNNEYIEDLDKSFKDKLVYGVGINVGL